MENCELIDSGDKMNVGKGKRVGSSVALGVE